MLKQSKWFNKAVRYGVAGAALAMPLVASATDSEATTAIVGAGVTIASIAAACGAAGVGIMIAIYGIRTGVRAFKAPK